MDITGILINLQRRFTYQLQNWNKSGKLGKKVTATDIPESYVLQRFFKRSINLTVVLTTYQSLNAT